ncbi:MAG: rhodanese-like domain-containing protein [Trueperaceae bacterium]|nr:rhodanese-like domain-containing protein [Trueperaceae bacterium]
MKRFLLVLATALLASGAFAQTATDQFGTIINEASQQGWLQINVENAANFIFEVEPFLLDVRSEEEFAAGHLEGAVLVPVTQLSERLSELPEDLSTPMIVYCAAGTRGNFALALLKLAGYENVRNMSGGFNGWKTAGFPYTE